MCRCPRRVVVVRETMVAAQTAVFGVKVLGLGSKRLLLGLDKEQEVMPIQG